jgi:regulator of protease activity HflC (stomatin/prohibitin superfamily)
VRFNDGGEGHVSGSVAWEIPTDDASLTAIHTMYGNPHNLEQQLIRTVVEKSVYMTGPLMSSRESFAERRNELIRFIEDQISGGVYETVTETVKEKDPMTGIEKTVGYVRIVLDDAGAPMRQEASPLTEFHIRTFNLSLNQIRYDERVEKQIESQQRATMQVQTAIAQAKEAEQAAITAEKNGQAEAAKAKWEQEVLKAKAVTKAEQQLEVARLERAAAEQEKQKQILLGQGEATRRKLVMQADNALDARLAAYVKVNQAYATALQNIKQPIVPLVQSGKDGGGGGNGVQAFMDLLVAKTARELGVKVNPAK